MKRIKVKIPKGIGYKSIKRKLLRENKYLVVDQINCQLSALLVRNVAFLADKRSFIRTVVF